MAPGPQAASTLAPAAALMNGTLAPGPAQAARKFGKSAAVFGVGGVAGSAPALDKPVQGGYPSTEAWDNIHGGGVGSLEVLRSATAVYGLFDNPAESYHDTSPPSVQMLLSSTHIQPYARQ